MQSYPGQKRGSTVYHYRGYNYVKDNWSLLTTVNYRCNKNKCRARARHPIDEPENLTVGLHNHAKDSTKFLTHELKSELRRRALEDLTTEVNVIFREVCARYPNVAEHLDANKERKRMRDIRRSALPRIPDTFAELAEQLQNEDEVRDLFAKSAALPDRVEKEDFFLQKLEGPEGTSLVFASPHLVETCLKQSPKIKVDATFKVMPGKPKGRQLLTVHSVHGPHTFPVVFCIMESKKKAAYGRFFDYLRNDLASGWAPEEGSADYEVALRWGMTTRYPLMQIIGCYFHFTQAVQKNWSQHGLMKIKASLKKESKDLKDSLMALPFAKASDIPAIFEDIDDDLTMAMKVKASGFLDYFKRTWLSENDRFFKPEDWSIYGHADRTTNHVESFHSRLHMQKPSIWKFLKLLIDIAVEARQNYGRFLNGVPFTRPVPLKTLWTEARVVQARALYDAGRIKPLAFIRWCRQTIRDTQAVVKQGRTLRRYLRAQREGLQYDDVATSSDESDGSYDWEYEPNPHGMEVAEAQDDEYDDQGDQNLEEGELAALNSNDETEALPSDSDSIWEIEEDAELLEISQQMDVNMMHELPQEAPPIRNHRESRPPNACVLCITDVATFICTPCHHAILCQTCKPHFFEAKCPRCGVEIADYIEFISS